ncbi:RsmB/NOP family class I SAM-dependent RNA methyltransferase [Thermostilla marina]
MKDSADASASSLSLDRLPAEFIERLRRITGDDWPHVATWFTTPQASRPVGFRVNTLKARPEAVLRRLEAEGLHPEPLVGIPGGFVVPGEQRERLTHSPCASQGEIYIQNPASMAAGLILASRPGEEILDLAAAPGGKTLHMAALMENRGRIAAVEPIRDRMYRLQANVRTAGATIVAFYRTDGRTVGRKTPGRFDRVLLDAPCSSEARIHPDDPESYRRWSPRKLRECARKQKGLLQSACLAARVGGLILYGTCSFAPEENEAVVAHVLERWGDCLEVESIEPLPEATFPLRRGGLREWNDRTFPTAVGNAVRILPHGATHGFFWCLLRKTAEPASSSHKRRHRKGRSPKKN